ncbi:hypothetical protein E2562_007553 [Oryza meyeriana var. granulata]|uniref:Uncharacterized protein n=1 Tax=Oryza meyeriana var. granulata TaxID=110450 RepID=A0A6G1DVG0_9ORYZ|nr:hypothetical protein E2562_007553 [Oryza meyeriana var. granulata]
MSNLLRELRCCKPPTGVDTSRWRRRPENYLIPVDTSGTFCFVFTGTNSSVSIVGNIQQQGFSSTISTLGSQCNGEVIFNDDTDEEIDMLDDRGWEC